jgi:hypothetical protein
MKKTTLIAALAAFQMTFITFAALAQDQPATASVASKGQMLVTANGARLAPVYRVGVDGSAQILIDSKTVTVPATTLTNVDGRLTTSLTKSEVLALH